MIGLGLCLFGVANICSYMLVFAPPFINPPFPFEHITILSVDSDSTWYQIDYNTPISAAAHDPYWLVWSLMLYAGIATMIMATTAQKLRNKI